MNTKQKMAYHAREYRRLKSLLVADASASDFLRHAKTLSAKARKVIGEYNKAKSTWEAARQKYDSERESIGRTTTEFISALYNVHRKGEINESEFKSLLVQFNKIASGQV